MTNRCPESQGRRWPLRLALLENSRGSQAQPLVQHFHVALPLCCCFVQVLCGHLKAESLGGLQNRVWGDTDQNIACFGELSKQLR